jgi:hypothetical protein
MMPQLAQPHIIGGDHDVGGQRQLDRQGERDAVDRHHHRLGYRVAPDPNGSKRCEPHSTCGPFPATAGSDPSTLTCLRGAQQR